MSGAGLGAWQGFAGRVQAMVDLGRQLDPRDPSIGRIPPSGMKYRDDTQAQSKRLATAQKDTKAFAKISNTLWNGNQGDASFSTWTR